ncbi:hypothetical protein H6503_04770 [Candidatus Woesearchaeota archaeon]|nr:hypothetical protein [Candidatus Woesearchaeota archaeon]
MPEEISDMIESCEQHGLEPDIMLSCIGLGHDAERVIPYLVEHRIMPENYLDAAFLLSTKEGMPYAERNNLEQSEFWRICSLYTWNLPEIDKFLAKDVPINKFKNMKFLSGHYEKDDLFEVLDFDSKKGIFTAKTRSKKIRNLLSMINSEKGESDIEEIVRSMVEKERDAFLDYGIDEAAQLKLNELGSNQHLNSADPQTIKLIAASYAFYPEGIDFAIASKQDPENILQVARAFHLSEEDTRFILRIRKMKDALLEDIYTFAKARKHSKHRFIKAMRAAMMADIHPDALEDFVTRFTYIDTNYSGAKSKEMSLVKAIESIPGRLHTTAMHLYGSHLDFGIANKILGYVARMPFYSLEDKQKVDSCIHNIRGMIERSDCDITLASIIDSSGISKNDMISIFGNEVAIAKESALENLDMYIMSQARQNDAEEYGIDEKVKGIFKGFVANHYTGSNILDFRSDNTFLVVFYPDDVTMNRLVEENIMTNSKYKNSVAFARCYFDGCSMKVAEISSEIYSRGDDIPEWFRQEYKDYAKVMLKALEYFASEAGFERIEVMTTETQIRKYANDDPIDRKEAFKTYTTAPRELGYRIEKSNIKLTEATKRPIDLGRYSYGEGSANSYDLSWVKDISPEDLSVYSDMFLRTRTEQETREAVLKLKDLNLRY